MLRTPKMTVQLTANFESNLATIAEFYAAVRAPRGYEVVIDELLDTVIPNLERFPDMGRPFMERRVGSVEAAAALTMLRAKLGAGSLREYVLKTTVVLYVRADSAITLLAIKHQRQLSFDFEQLWVSERHQA